MKGKLLELDFLKKYGNDKTLIQICRKVFETIVCFFLKT